jgi:hypothetical protein
MGTWNSSKSKGKSKLSQMAPKVPLSANIFHLTELMSWAFQRQGPCFYCLWAFGKWNNTLFDVLHNWANLWRFLISAIPLSLTLCKLVFATWLRLFPSEKFKDLNVSRWG